MMVGAASPRKTSMLSDGRSTTAYLAATEFSEFPGEVEAADYPIVVRSSLVDVEIDWIDVLTKWFVVGTQ
jgi:hypothetical protein